MGGNLKTCTANNWRRNIATGIRGADICRRVEAKIRGAEMKKAAIALFFALMLLADAHAAEVTVADDCLGRGCAYFNGEIKSGDLIKLKTAFDSPTRRRRFVRNHELFTLVLNSRGGSLEEAMEIGRWVRKNKIATSMPTNAECLSSCVYILAAGVGKLWVGTTNGNKVGIHRPYLTQMPKESVQAAISKALADSKAYFSEMNIPEQLADAMFSIPPDKVEILTDDELSFYRLNGVDMAFEEEIQLENAARFGMTRQQYMENLRLFEDETKKKCWVLKAKEEGSKCIETTAKKYGLHSSQLKQSR